MHPKGPDSGLAKPASLEKGGIPKLSESIPPAAKQGVNSVVSKG